jgi:hypothetical protein
MLCNAVAVATLIIILYNAVWHRYLIQLFHLTWINFLGLVGSTGPGFISPVIVSLFSIVSTMVIIGFMQGLSVMQQHWAENACIALTVLVVSMAVVYGPQFAWEVASTGYQHNQDMVKQVQGLLQFASSRDRFQHELNAAKADAGRWQDAYNGISKGEIVPDRILNREETDRLHDELTKYAMNSGDKKYSTARIAPAFWQDQESAYLAQQLFRAFNESKWMTLPPQNVSLSELL